MPDLLLVFPPQWSPFQPALSLPSLSAWLKRARFQVQSFDMNLAFYEWLLSDECAGLLIGHLDALDWSEDTKLAYRSIFLRAADFRQGIQNLKDDSTAEQATYVSQHYQAVKSLEIYMDAISEVEQSFTITPYDFRLAADNLRTSALELAVESPPELIDRFVQKIASEVIAPASANAIGISCIGQEQLYFTLLLGASLKKSGITIPIFVGGTIFARIYERGAITPGWFQRFFDIIVRNEGEKPCEQLLSNLRDGRELIYKVPSIVYAEGDNLVASPICAPLSPAELPTPDFDDTPLNRYFSTEITLPLLSSRGCYWGKCEFCHHGMVYGEKYAGYDVSRVLESVTLLAERYGVHHFAFNDEAIPPKIARAIGEKFPENEKTGWNFTGLIKFEKFFKNEDFRNLHNIGFRSLYVGLESASERVLALMKKNNTRETMVSNLSDATSAGIWMHCFAFFGFPGETDAEAQETHDFILQNADIISSYGSAIFVLEHNAPIFRHLADYGLKIKSLPSDNIDVYYDFEVSTGITPGRALEWMHKLNNAALDIPSYNAAGWLPRELQLCVLAKMTPQDLVSSGLRIREQGGLPGELPLRDFLGLEMHPSDSARIIVNRINGRVFFARGKMAELFDLCCGEGLTMNEALQCAPDVFSRLSSGGARLTSEAVLSPVPAPL
ncbi:anaerobic magnesium-protoporphyrin IX monomethyl ester cyclase [Kitasatospora sp. MAA19]|uniref:B12-binding domain-containing radical SAM protein n=1 Tax=Kitasatospora sp. MAA19 TaxID=3035090 RepID=UPI0024762F54|nr:radical SAM protein [Kitasatospora sp. MAA19]MDH6710817.1 anaerobic magnesium-protoporphyrin IX monomethyl ester cyclase [Kitasatospora sp. MAA19]